MLSLSLGPVALPVAPLLLALGVWTAARLAAWLAARTQPAALAAHASRTVFDAALLGLLAARLAHLALHADLYAADPLSAIDIRDGGWYGPAGLAAGAAWLAWRGWRVPGLRRPLAAGSLGGAVLCGAAALATGQGQGPALSTLPALAFTDLASGQSTTLAQAARGRPVVVNLWASWCGPCRQEMPVLAAAQQREVGVGLLFVNQGETPAAVRAYLATQGLNLREVLLDSGSALGPAVGSRGLPTTLFFDAQGRQVDAHFGVLNAAALEAKLRRLR